MIYRRMVAILSSPWALWVLVALCASWTALGFRVGFRTEWFQFAANTPLSWGAMFIALLILVDARREQRALHLKLDELIRSVDKARNHFMGIEAADDTHLDDLAVALDKVQDDVAAAAGPRTGGRSLWGWVRRIIEWVR